MVGTTGDGADITDTVVMVGAGTIPGVGIDGVGADTTDTVVLVTDMVMDGAAFITHGFAHLMDITEITTTDSGEEAMPIIATEEGITIQIRLPAPVLEVHCVGDPMLTPDPMLRDIEQVATLDPTRAELSILEVQEPIETD